MFNILWDCVCAICAILYWNATDERIEYFGEERHGIRLSPSSHVYHHFIDGLRYIPPGLGLNTIDADQSGDVDAHAQFGVDSGYVADEDIIHSIDALTSFLQKQLHLFPLFIAIESCFHY